VETQTTDIPGIQGIPGVDGVDGVNAFTTTTADFVVPAVGATVTIFVVDSSWMVVGQPIFIEGPATFTVASITNSTQIVATFLGNTGDVSPGATISTGAGVSPGGIQGTVTDESAYASGTAYSLTNTSALLNLGTTPASLTITTAGTYLLFARVRYDYNGATFAAVRTVTTKIRRTNNTAADVTNATGAWKTQIITTLTFTAALQNLPVVQYTTATAGDILQLWGSVNTVPSAGSLDAVEAEIVAVKIAP
jgi:hypothetical protein